MKELDEKLISKYFGGECSDSEMEQLCQWFEESEDNRKEWLKLRVAFVKGKFEDLSSSEHLQASLDELKRRKYEYEALKKKIVRRITLRIVGYAACILILVGLSAMGYRWADSVLHPEILVCEVAKDEMPRKLLLEDSTEVWISAGSRLEYPEKFSSQNRVVSVEGKVYFDVSKDKQHPFIVQTEAYSIKVLGTSFEVNSFKGERFSDVVLVEGSVDILNKNAVPLCRLHPGQQFKLDRENNHFNLTDVNVDFYTGWRKGKIDFDGMSLKEILEGLEHYYNVQIVLDDSIELDEQFVGSLTLKRDIYEMIKTLERVIPFKYKVQTNTVVYINP